MCNRYRLEHKTIDDFVRDFSELKIPLLFPDGAVPNLPSRRDIRPTNKAPIFRPIDPANPYGGLEMVEARWGLVPFFTKAIDRRFLCTNARSETVSTTPSYRDPFKRRRCLVAADGYYEWTGEKGAKTKWLFTRVDGAAMIFPGLWDSATIDGERLESFTMLTCAPGPDQANYHDRQPVVLEPNQWATWLDLSADVASLLHGSATGSIHVEIAPPEIKHADEA